MNEILDRYVSEGRLSRKTTVRNGIPYSVLCYTKMAFFAFDWDEILISHRGKIYRDDTGLAINNPIPKIFNLDEHPSSTFVELEKNMAEHHYEVLDKVNGHLVIVSPDASSHFKNVLVSTKGSFEMLAVLDEELVHKMGMIKTIKRLSLNYTLMFECLAKYDKHLWYEDQKARYGGEDTMVLLAAVDNNTGEELNYDQLKQMAWTLGCPLTHRYETLVGTDVNKWFEHKNIEGYVVHFPELKSRIKVKTKEYTTLRYLKNITSEKLVNQLYNSGMESLYLDQDEEMYPIVDALKLDMVHFWLESLGDVETTSYRGKTKKEIALDKSLNVYQRQYWFGVADDFFPFDIMERVIEGKSFRKEFKVLNNYPFTEKAILEMFGNKAALLAGDITV